jgi:biotin carboxyl carrier protein
MKRYFPIHQIKWPITLGVLAGLLALAFVVHGEVRKEREREQESDKVPKKKGNDNPGEITVKAKNDTFEVATPRLVSGWTEPLTVYGRVVPNPKATYEVRSAFPGTLKKGPNGWVALGQQLKAGATVGYVSIRLDPQVRLDFQNKLQEATKQQEGAVETRKILEARVKRFQGAPQSVPPRELEDALVALAEAKTKEAVARAAVQVWTRALAEIDRPGNGTRSPWIKALKAPAAGEVTELTAQPGTAVDAGGLVLRVVDFRRLLVRLDFPQEALAQGPPRTVELQADRTPPAALRGARNQPEAGSPPGTVKATLVGLVPQVDAASQFAGYFYEIDATAAKVTWRPGLFVRAELKGVERTDMPRQSVLSVPGTALLYHQGRAIVYVRINKTAKTTTFKRCEVQVLGSEGARWILAVNQLFDKDDLLVTGNAQLLLSEEFNKADDDD